MTSPPSCAKNLEIGALSYPYCEFCVPSHSRGCDSTSKPEVLVRSLPPFPLYSLAGAVDGGVRGGEGCSGDCGNVWGCSGRGRRLPMLWAAVNPGASALS